MATSMKKLNSQTNMSEAENMSRRHLAASVLTAAVRAHNSDKSNKANKIKSGKPPPNPQTKQYQDAMSLKSVDASKKSKIHPDG
jgi:hypothetical protein